jgi:hypothetical protein
MKYPEDWGLTEIHHYETGELFCPRCDNSYDEELFTKTEEGEEVCPSCLEEIQEEN